MEKKVFYVLFIAMLATPIGLSIIEPLMAIYAKSLGATGIYIGLIFAAFTISRGLFTPLAGKLSDHHGRKWFITAGTAAYVIASLLYMTAHSTQALILVRLLQGMSTAFVAPLAMAYIGDIAPPKQEGKYMGPFSLSLFLGLGIGPVIGGTLNHYFSMNAAFIAMAAFGMAALMLLLLMLPELGTHKEKKPTPFIEILKDKKLQEIIFIRLVTSFGVSGFIVFLPLYATQLGLNTAQIGAMVTLNLLATALPQRYFGKIADRHNKTMLTILGNIILAISMLLVPLAKNFYTLSTLNLIMGLGGAIMSPANTALAVKIGKQHGMGSVMGLLQTSFSAGMAAGPLIAGVVLDYAGLTTVFIYTAGLLIAGTAAFYLFTRSNSLKLEA